MANFITKRLDQNTWEITIGGVPGNTYINGSDTMQTEGATTVRIPEQILTCLRTQLTNIMTVMGAGVYGDVPDSPREF